jgi:hypothetical protein
MDIENIKKKLDKKFNKNCILERDAFESKINATDLCLTDTEKTLNKLLNTNNCNVFYEVKFRFLMLKFKNVDREAYIRINILDNNIKVPVRTIIEHFDKDISDSDISKFFNKIDIIKKYIFEFNIDVSSIRLGNYSDIESDIFEKLKKYNTLNKNNITDFLDIKLKHCSQYFDYRRNIIDAIEKDIIKTVNLYPDYQVKLN